jgi:uncharacterized protein YbcI
MSEEKKEIYYTILYKQKDKEWYDKFLDETGHNVRHYSSMTSACARAQDVLKESLSPFEAVILKTTVESAYHMSNRADRVRRYSKDIQDILLNLTSSEVLQVLRDIKEIHEK